MIARKVSLFLAALLFALLSTAVAPPAAADDAGGPVCIPTSGGMDYHSFLCVDSSNPLCPVYTLTATDWGVQKRCFGVLRP